MRKLIENLVKEKKVFFVSLGISALVFIFGYFEHGRFTVGVEILILICLPMFWFAIKGNDTDKGIGELLKEVMALKEED